MDRYSSMKIVAVTEASVLASKRNKIKITTVINSYFSPENSKKLKKYPKLDSRLVSLRTYLKHVNLAKIDKCEQWAL